MGWQDFTQRVLGFVGADLLISDLAHKLAPSQTYLPTLEQGYGGLIIATNTPSAPADVTCTVTDATGIVPPWSQKQHCDSINPVTFVPPYTYPTASALRIVLTSSVNQTINSTTFIFGMSSMPPSMQGSQLIRPDGRAYPIGQNGATGSLNASNGPATVIAAPAAGVRILLLSIEASNQTANTLLQVLGHVGGALVNVVTARGNGSSVVYAPPGGLLLDAATALTVQGISLPTGEGIAFYDLVT